MPSENSVGESHRSVDSSPVAHQAMVGAAAPTVGGPTKTDPGCSKKAASTNNRTKPPGGISPAAGMQAVRQALQRQKLSKRAINIIMKS